ncbi:(2Fe-2S)-binding protein [Ochrovirga pacifica]|uniref:(2Fe-2S)-binding protein n=1 Tax=Ochrovirga pacifica TaxID=1042376 RepID=UPI000255A842|nr:(2Fe-2S)-binding protein [Ochrovirga pacifica]
MEIQLTVNNKTHTVDVPGETPLLWVLRDELKLVGTKFGCGVGQCGACSVHMDGIITRSCLLPVSIIDKAKITTIEGLSEKNNHPVQLAWREIDVPQCGYCQAGQIMTASAFLAQNQNPSQEEIKEAMHGNICRCATYKRIERAVQTAVEISKKTTK